MDIIRISCILLIGAEHIGQRQNIWPLNFVYPTPIINIGVGGVAVWILIFVSGASLAISHSTVKVFSNLKGFYIGRLLRIYPAFWISMALPIIIVPAILNKINWTNIIPVLAGFTAFAGNWGEPINGIYWFIGLIVCLYLLYPFLSKFIDWNPVAAMVALILISGFSVLLVTHFSTISPFDNNGIRWFPLCNLAFFGAGIFYIRTGLYPKITTSSVIIPYLAGLSFFIFLYHYPLLSIADVSLPVYIVILAGICMVAMYVDDYIHVAIKEGYALISKNFRIWGSR